METFHLSLLQLSNTTSMNSAFPLPDRKSWSWDGAYNKMLDEAGKGPNIIGIGLWILQCKANANLLVPAGGSKGSTP